MYEAYFVLQIVLKKKEDYAGGISNRLAMSTEIPVAVSIYSHVHFVCHFNTGRG